MNEDIAGTQAAATRTDYATCAECGLVFLRRAARPVEASPIDGSLSEFTEICPDCEALDSQGERVLTTDPGGFGQD
ncbi:MAG: hypothetical protein K0Q72_164 [Armatimonadetes bacterium]|jgi:hypothetical protein|nr:hypothetical protein [Armatimonadota bacterium]